MILALILVKMIIRERSFQNFEDFIVIIVNAIMKKQKI